MITRQLENLLNLSARQFLLITTLWLLCLAGLRPLMLPDEGRYVGVAWEMLQHSNWLVPTLDGLPFFHKPPLFYWLTMIGLEVLGRNGWAARIASVLGALLVTTLLHRFLNKYSGRPQANLSIAVLVTQPFFFAGSQYANLDMLVASMIAASVITGAEAALELERRQKYLLPLIACYVFAALGILAKGLIGVVLPSGILFVWLVLRGQIRLLPRMLSPLPVLLLLFICTPWFLAMEQTYPGFSHYFFIHHHFQRFAETGFNNQQPFWFYVPVLLLLTLPWSPWVLRVARRTFWSEKEKSPVRSLMLVWTAVVLLFFSLPSSKIIGYILPALPPFACLLGDAIHEWVSRSARSGRWLASNLLLAMVVCIAAIVAAGSSSVSGLNRMPVDLPSQFKPDDQIVMLNYYQYDLPYYLGAQKFAWVVDDWQSPEIRKRDNWRKELYDAGLFAPDEMARQLINSEELGRRLCANSAEHFLFWGQKEAVDALLNGHGKALFSTARQTLWRLSGAEASQLKLCSEKPSSG